MSKPAPETFRLVAATDAHFVALATNEAPDGLGLPEGGIDTREIIEMLGALAGTVRLQIDPAAWLIVNDDEVVGLCSITKPFASPGVVEIGYGIAPERRGHGFATRAVGKLLELARADERIKIVAAETAIDNPPSQRTLEKNGFTRIGGRIDPDDGAVFCWQVAVG
ncbi:GNAT family N-acetyltransferase [Devosia sp.]|uniref:GNAT family N-acetyltransferase n=1 Tax=Devosia sp. TaxID=1871048 RepID=UPI002FC7BF99